MIVVGSDMNWLLAAITQSEECRILDPVVGGSKPSGGFVVGPDIKMESIIPHGLMVVIRDFHSRGQGSIPCGGVLGTIQQLHTHTNF